MRAFLFGLIVWQTWNNNWSCGFSLDIWRLGFRYRHIKKVFGGW